MGFRSFATMMVLLCMTGLCTAASILVYPKKDTIEVLVEGPERTKNFALIFERTRAGISGWYDLDEDPKMTRNLAPTGQEHPYSLFNTASELRLGNKKVSIGPGKATSMSLVERGPERVVIEMTGPLVKLDGTRASDDFPRLIELATGRVVAGDQLPTYEVRYTLYPTGAVYVRMTWKVHGVALTVANHHAVLATAATDECVALNDWKGNKRPFTWPVIFVLHHGTGPRYRSDALLTVHFGRFTSDWLGQHVASTGQKSGWFRSGFKLVPKQQRLPEGHYIWNFLLHVEPGTAGQRQIAFDLAEDYRHPATLRLTDEGWGQLDVHGSGDANADGYSERDGAYNLVSGTKGVRFLLPAKTYPRINPVFQVTEWKGRPPTRIRMDRKVLNQTRDYNTCVRDGVLILQYLGVVRNATADFEFLQDEYP